MSRIYVVTDSAGDTSPALIRATSQAQAIRHAVGARFNAGVATQDTLVELLKAGVQVQEAAVSAPQEALL